MIDLTMTPERLLAHVIIFGEAARLRRNERVAGELRQLAERCVKAARLMVDEIAETSSQAH